jgi:hypothetical protein
MPKIELILFLECQSSIASKITFPVAAFGELIPKTDAIVGAISITSVSLLIDPLLIPFPKKN